VKVIFTFSSESSRIFETSLKVFPGITALIVLSFSTASLLKASLSPSSATKLSFPLSISNLTPVSIGLISS
jgi:hypothetical protein